MCNRWDEENQLLVQSHQQFLSELTADYDGQVRGYGTPKYA